MRCNRRDPTRSGHPSLGGECLLLDVIDCPPWTPLLVTESGVQAKDGNAREGSGAVSPSDRSAIVNGNLVLISILSNGG